MRPVLALLLAVFTASGGDADDGWIALFDGESLAGWTEQGPAKWHVEDGAIVAISGEYGWLRHDSVFADFELQCEFRSTPGANSGIFLRASSAGMPHLTGYELQVNDQHEYYPTGSLVGHATATGARITGEWQTFHVIARGQRLRVSLDGKPLLALRDGKSTAGYIGLQFGRGEKVRFRNIRVRPLPAPGEIRPRVQRAQLRAFP